MCSFFFKDPSKIFPLIDDDYVFSGRYKDDMPQIEFLRTECLNSDLYDFLKKMGYPEKSLDFIKTKNIVRPENTPRKTEGQRKKYYSTELIEKVKYKERLLLRLCSDFGCAYEAPIV